MNDSDEIFWLGYCYEYGIAVEKDEKKAFINYKKSADMNNSRGIYQVGYCYYLGIGVEMDKSKAFIYYQKSAEAGNSMGIFKTALCYHYGIGVANNNEKYSYWIGKDKYPRNSAYGICKHCNEYNTYEAWCRTCDPDIIIQGWTSGNKDIDYCIKEFQLRTDAYTRMIEWISFDRLCNIVKIGDGGFGSVFSAIWKDGIRKIEYDNNNYIRVRQPYSIVALKTLSSSKENSHYFLKEFDNHIKCKRHGSSLEIYGITQNTETNEYFMVFQYANGGNLYKFLRINFRDLTWQTKLKLLKDISSDLFQIHDAGYIHADFHSGNILQDKHLSENIQSYISDLGLSKKIDEDVSEGNIYGVMPYVAPEVLSSQEFTKAADIYGFGVIMSEVSTGQRPFDGYKFDIDLAVKICNGLRPEFASGTPNCYIKLAIQCMDSSPNLRPTAWDVCQKLDKWYESMEFSFADETKEQFLKADKIVKALPINSPKHPDSMYTSKMISTKRISIAIKDYVDSKQIDLNFPDSCI